MEKAINDAIKLLAERITTDVKAPDALDFTQAALNLVRTAKLLKIIKNQERLRGLQPGPHNRKKSP